MHSLQSEEPTQRLEETFSQELFDQSSNQYTQIQNYPETTIIKKEGETQLIYGKWNYIAASGLLMEIDA